MEKRELELQEEEEKSIFWTLGKAILALVLVWGMIYFSGIRQYLFFRETPSDIEVAEMEKVLDVKTREIPVAVFIIRESTLGSKRGEDSINSMLENSSQVLNQTGINLKLNTITEVNLKREELIELIDGDFTVLDLDQNKINLILVKTLGELNGLAYPARNLTIIPDYLAGRDYRTLAHEIGHIFGLGHNEDQRYVMNQGSTGVLFSKEEVKIIRERLDEKF